MSNNFDFESLLVRKEIFTTLDTGDREHPVEIYNPNTEQRKMILNLIVSNLKQVDDKLTTNISGYDLMFKLLDELTNVKLGFDVNNPEHQERVNRIVNDPSDLFIDLNNQLTKIVMKQFYRYYDNLKEILLMPEELRESYLESLEKKIQEESNNKIELDSKENEIKELEEKLKSLKEGK